MNTPFPEKTMLAKGDADTDEINEVINAGYQRAVGMILWAVRHVFIEGKYGVSVLCSVMAYPSWKAFKAAMHMSWGRGHTEVSSPLQEVMSASSMTWGGGDPGKTCHGMCPGSPHPKSPAHPALHPPRVTDLPKSWRRLRRASLTCEAFAMGDLCSATPNGICVQFIKLKCNCSA